MALFSSLRFSSKVAVLGAVSLLLVSALGSAAQAQRVPRLGVDGGVFFPTSSKTRDVFGSNFTSIGLGLGSTQVYRRRITPDFDLLRQKRGDNRATVVFAGAKITAPLGRAQLSERRASFAPYGGFGLNLTYADIKAPSVGIDETGFGVGASAILGASFGGRFFTEGRYRLSSSAADFNFSGAQAVIGVRF